MAKAPMSKTQSPPPAADDDAMNDSATDQDTGAEQDGDEGGKVLLTVLDNGDGTYTLIHGDEDEGGDEGGAEGSDDQGAEEGDGDESGPERETFQSVGALMKGILDCVNEHESGAKGSEQDNFQAGFDGGSDASEQKPAQKY